MPIKNLSEARRLPRLGKIHLGVKKVANSGKEYPSEVSHFVVPPEVSKVFGENPKSLRVMFPVENEEIFFPQWYKNYGANLLKCKGDGEKAFTWDEDGGGMKEIPCPCPKLESGDCKQVGILQFLLPDVPGAGIWQVTTSSKNSIIDVNSSIAFIRGICGRIRMIPLILKREEMVMQRTENGQPKKSTHYTLKLDLDENLTLRQLQQAAQVRPEMVLLPPPDESKDELFYPPNGFKVATPAKEERADGSGGVDAMLGVKEPLPTATPDDAPAGEKEKELGCLVAELREMKFRFSPAEEKRLKQIATDDARQSAINYFMAQKLAILKRQPK